MSPPWMPLYVADYMADTGHLSASENGAYIMLIMHYWRHGKLPSDEASIARITRMTSDEWRISRATLRALFGDGWSHKRVDAELAKAEEKHKRRENAGRNGGLAKASNARILLEQTPSNALASSSQPQPEKKEDATHLVRLASDRSEFVAFWKRYPHKVGKGAAEKSFARARKASSFEALMAGLDAYVIGKRADCPWCNPATWLNQQRWLDEPAPPPQATPPPWKKPMMSPEELRRAMGMDAAE